MRLIVEKKYSNHSGLNSTRLLSDEKRKTKSPTIKQISHHLNNPIGTSQTNYDNCVARHNTIEFNQLSILKLTNWCKALQHN